MAYPQREDYEMRKAQAQKPVHLASGMRPFAACRNSDASEPHTKKAGEVTCPDCQDWIQEHGNPWEGQFD
jgi:hypothetical protein